MLCFCASLTPAPRYVVCALRELSGTEAVLAGMRGQLATAGLLCAGGTPEVASVLCTSVEATSARSETSSTIQRKSPVLGRGFRGS